MRASLYVQRGVSGTGDARQSRRPRKDAESLGAPGKFAPRVTCVCRPGRSVWAPGTRGSVRGRAFLVFLGVGPLPCPARPRNLDPPPSGPLRPRIATQHSVGHEETRMPACMSVRDSGLAHRARLVATVAVASGCDAVRRRRTNAGKRGEQTDAYMELAW